MEMKRSGRVLAAGVARVLRQRPQTLAAPTATVEWRVAFVGVRGVSSIGQNGIPKGLDTSNPFEIKFHIEDTPVDVDEDDADAAVESCSFEDEIEKFHSEMIGVFGSEPEEHDGSGHDGLEAHKTADINRRDHTTLPPMQGSTAMHSRSASRPHEHGFRQPPRPATTLPQPTSSGKSSIVIIHGPCTFVHHEWVGSKDRWPLPKVAAVVDGIAQSRGLGVVQHHSNHEGQILDWLLGTSPSDKIILNWNGRLADSPTVYRALSRVCASVVLLAPLDVELGPLPASVKGVISGFGAQSLELAVQACK